MGEIINVIDLAKSIKGQIAEFVSQRANNGEIIPKIASIVVGEDGGSIFYINSQEKVANSLGILFEKILLKESTTEENLINEIISLNNNEKIHGIYFNYHYKHIDEKKVISYISPDKDIDCLTYINQGKLYAGHKKFIPCTPNSVVTILDSLNINLQGKEVVVVGRSNIVGKPVAVLMLERNCTVTVCHSKTKDLQSVCQRADILILAIGIPNYIDSSYVKEEAIVIDVGTSSLNGKITGDVLIDDVIGKVSYMTKVPGGVGSLTTTLLMKNVCEALK